MPITILKMSGNSDDFVRFLRSAHFADFAADRSPRENEIAHRNFVEESKFEVIL
jgi:hypothetical protein